MEVRKYRDEASQREAEVRTIHGEFVSQGEIRRDMQRSTSQVQDISASVLPQPSRPVSAGRGRASAARPTGQVHKTASEAPSDQWTRGRDPWTLGGGLEYDLITGNQYQRSRELADYERTQRGEQPYGSVNVLVNTPCTPGIHLGRGYNAGYIPPESLSQTQRNIEMSTPNHVNAQNFGMHTPPHSPNPPRGPPTNMSGNHNPGGNGDQAPRPASYMRDGCIIRNGGGPPDETPPPDGDEPGGHWDEWNRTHGGGDGYNNGDWDGAES